MAEIKLDDKENRIFPHPKVLEAYADEKKGNGFARHRSPEDDVYETFYNACRRNPFNCDAKTVIRTRTIKDGKLKEVIYSYCEVKGINNSGGEQQYFYWDGVYDEPIFNKKLNKDTDLYETESVRDHVRKYDYEFNQKNVDEIFKHVNDATVFMVKESPEITQGFPINDVDGFRNANFLQLLEMGKSKRSLKDIIELAKNTLEISEKKQEAEVKKQAEIAESIGEKKSAEEILDMSESTEVKVTKSKKTK